MDARYTNKDFQFFLRISALIFNEDESKIGKNNRYGHPNNEVIENLKKSTIYRTDLDGSIMFKIKKDKLEIKTCAL